MMKEFRKSICKLALKYSDTFFPDMVYILHLATQEIKKTI